MKAKIYIKYILFLYILAISGFEFFFRVDLIATYLLFPVTVIIFFLYREKFDFSVFLVIFPFFIAYILQYTLHGSPINNAFTLLIRFITFYLVIKIIGRDFIKILINTIKIISISSLFFYTIQYIPTVYNFIISLCSHFTTLGVDESGFFRPNIIIYTIQQIDPSGIQLFRNSGPFWEPGLYVVFLNIALFLNTFIKKSLVNKTNALFFINILTTFSTTGTIVLLMIITIFSITLKSLPIQIRVAMILMLLISVPVISSLPFMTEKINDQLNQSDVSFSRFGAVKVHWNIIKDYPFSGLPPDEASYAKYSDDISPNGITEIFVRYGLITGIIYYILLFKSCNYLVTSIGYKNKGYLLFLVMIVSIFSQTIGNRPIYLLFIFAPIGITLINTKLRVLKLILLLHKKHKYKLINN